MVLFVILVIFCRIFELYFSDNKIDEFTLQAIINAQTLLTSSDGKRYAMEIHTRIVEMIQMNY